MIRLPSEPRRVLIVKPSALGDIVHALPVVALLRKRFPAAEISWLVTPAFAPLLEDHPHIDQVWRFDRGPRGIGWRGVQTFGRLHGLQRQLRAYRFDLVLDLQGLFRSGWLAAQTMAPMRVGFGYAREGAPMFYTHKVRSRGVERHAIERYLDVAEELGCGRGPVAFEFGVSDATRARVRGQVGASPYCVLLPGTNWATKRWPVERFVTLARRIEDERGIRCVLAGGNDVTALVPADCGVASLAGKTSLKELVALLEGATLVVANDSGPMHIAAALGRPLVSLFGPTNPVRTGPYARPDTVLRLDIVCSPCYRRTCVHHSCLRQLTDSHVMAAIGEQLVHLGIEQG
jgi:lipopolysaccharide heptosyltransferase I